MLLLLLVAGCRLRFDDAVADGGSDADVIDVSPDAKPCTPVGHDEDTDGFDDACDVCPQLTDDQLDTDGDGIGDACDLAATAQTRVMFDPFTQMTASWIYMGGTFSIPDVYRFDSPAAGAGAVLVGAPGRETFEVNGNLIDGGAGANQTSISIGSGTDHYYCELYDDGATFALTFTHTPDEVVYNTLDTTPIPGRFDSGPYRLIMDHTPPTSTCIAVWKGTRYSVTAPNPSTPAAEVGFGVFSVILDVYSFVRLTTP